MTGWGGVGGLRVDRYLSQLRNKALQLFWRGLLSGSILSILSLGDYRLSKFYLLNFFLLVLLLFDLLVPYLLLLDLLLSVFLLLYLLIHFLLCRIFIGFRSSWSGTIKVDRLNDFETLCSTVSVVLIDARIPVLQITRKHDAAIGCL